ncbi:MAG: sugar phosphate nucleotidyltransferase, partial [candidate division Zixibacteria bacterium]|nr:sugar phosphate nucleotidyltransferase [candidate division Zixibacteria bacterium]
NKHLLDVCGKPMIHYSLSILADAGVKDVTLVSNPQHVESFERLLSDNFGGRFDVMRFVAQRDKPGIAGSILMMPPEERRGPYMVVLGDNIIGGTVAPSRAKFDRNPNKALIHLAEVPYPKMFGVAHLEDGKVEAIEEKPEDDSSHWAITGIYFFPSDLFDMAANVRPSHRGEYEVTDILSAYLDQGRLEYHMLDCWWVDAGTHKSLARAKHLLCGGKSSEGGS